MEDSLWRYVRDKLLPPGIHATRIESFCSPGFPDVHYTYQGVSGTLELKFLRKKSLPFGDEGLNQNQILWIPQQLEAHGRVWIIAEALGDIFVLHGRHYEHFNELSYDELYEASEMIWKKRLPAENTAGLRRMFHELLVKK